MGFRAYSGGGQREKFQPKFHSQHSQTSRFPPIHLPPTYNPKRYANICKFLHVPYDRGDEQIWLATLQPASSPSSNRGYVSNLIITTLCNYARN